VQAFAIGKAIVDDFAWVQDELSSKPHTFNHGDVKPPNRFMMSGNTPAFFDWQVHSKYSHGKYSHGKCKCSTPLRSAMLAIAFFDRQYTAVGKGCQDILFFLIEGYEVAECRRLEPIVMAHYHSSLVQRGVTNYTFNDLRRDWKLACMHFPLYVALWRGPLAEKRRPGKHHSLANPGLLGRPLPAPGWAAYSGCAAAPLAWRHSRLNGRLRCGHEAAVRPRGAAEVTDSCAAPHQVRHHVR
jgi:hypothetical protein